MSFKFYIDTNIFLNSYLNRDDGVSTSILLFLEKMNIEIYLNDISIINIAYILRKDFNSDEIKKTIDYLTLRYKIVCAKTEIISKANNSTFKDFEDAVQYFCAKEVESNLIITNNKKDFINSDIETITANEFYDRYIRD